MVATLSRDVLEAAAQWYVELRCAPADPALVGAHSRWLAADPSHAQAWARVARLEDKLGRIAPGIGERTLNTAFARRRATLKVLGVLLLTGSGSLWTSRRTPVRALVADAHTATGVRRTLNLADGSQVELNTGSALNIRYDARLRSLELVRGEIAVRTAVDPLSRPFVVHTPAGSVRALGTRFVVRADPDATWVSVQAHSVEVRPARLTEQPIRVNTGQCVQFTAASCGAVTRATGDEDAWTRGMLVAHDWPLTRFLAELGRYREGYLGCAERIAGLRISGAFQLADTDAVLRNLSTTLTLRVRHFTRYWVHLEPA